MKRTRAGGAKRRPTRYGSFTSNVLAAALRAHRRGEFADAVARYRQCLEVDPSTLDAVINLGAVLVALGRAHEASGAYDLATPLAANNARALRDIGIGLSAIGRFDCAIRSLEAAIAIEPTQAGAKFSLVRVYAEAGRRSAALALARQLTTQCPEDPSAWLELHRASFDDRHPQECLEAARRAFDLAPSDPQVRLLYSGVLGLMGERYADLLECDAIAEGLASALRYALEWRDARVFSTKRETLEFALESARGSDVVLEFGVRHGISTRVIAERHKGPVHGFDSFVGLPETWQKRPAGTFSTHGELPSVPHNVVFHVGAFADTLPPFVKTLNQSPKLVHIDSDLYSSAKTVLDALATTLAAGCVIVFDEYIGNASWKDDEYRAMSHAVLEHGFRCEVISISWITGQAALRLL